MRKTTPPIFVGAALMVFGPLNAAFAQEESPVAEVEAPAEVAPEPDVEPNAEVKPSEEMEQEPEPEPAVIPEAEEPTEQEVEEEEGADTPELLAAETETKPVEPQGYLDPKFNIGTGLRVGYTFDTHVAEDGSANTMGTNIRPYMNGQVSKHIKFEANFDSYVANAGPDVVASVRVLDAVIKLEVDPLLNFWFGRFLPPSDRPNLSGPYFQNSWNYPVNTNLFPAIYAGRNDGLAYWGQVKEGLFKWQLGLFDLTGDNNPLFAGRVVLNLLEPEGGYYNSSTYYGAKDVLAFAATLQYQEGGDTATGTGIDGAAAEFEVFFEKTFGTAGTLNAEAEYYNFESTDQGQSFAGVLSYLLPGTQGPGALQPEARIQVMIPEAGDTYPTIDAAMNYIVDGHNCRFSLNYQHVGGHDGIDPDDLITLGGQIQMF